MLPNWLLGKSKSKLQEILGGGGGGGTTYTAGDGIDISNGVISFDPETTPTIDPSKIDGLDDDLAALAPKTALSNPNILHNPWFSVNQRGFTTNSGSAQMWPADRWYIIGDNKTVTRASDGMLTIKNEANTNVNLTQKGATNKMASLIGKKVTASIMMSDGTIKSGTIIFNANERQSYISESNFELYKNNSSGNNILFAFTMPAGELTIKALKLEVGEISTLHLDPRPEYATELLKCQRYFYSMSGNQYFGIAMAAGVTSERADAVIYLPIEMINTPTVTLQGTLALYGGASSIPLDSNINVINKMSNVLSLHLYDGTNKAITPMASYKLMFNSANNYLYFNAEL